MELDIKWDEYKTQVNESGLDENLKAAMHNFLDEFAALPVKPNTFNPWWFTLSLWWLMEEICVSKSPESLLWEMYLGMAKRWAADRGEAGQKALASIKDLTPLLTAHFSNDDTEVALKEITGESVHYVLMLSDTLSEPKKFFVAPNSQSLAEANFTKQAWYRAIYAGKALVGFVMLYLNEENNTYMVWRMMIGEPFHGRGYGRMAMEAVIEHICTTYPEAEELILSYGQGPGSPEGFYKKLGFVPTGKVEFGEAYASLSLK